MMSVVWDVLDLATMDAGQLELTNESIDIQQLLEQGDIQQLLKDPKLRKMAMDALNDNPEQLMEILNNPQYRQLLENTAN